MAILRYVILAFALFFVSHANAETIPAGRLWSIAGIPTGSFSTVAEAQCRALVTYNYGGYYSFVSVATAEPAVGGSTALTCNVMGGGQASTLHGGYLNPQGDPFCPANQGWTMDGQNCVREPCTASQVRDSTGVCKTNCPTGYHQRTPDNGQCEKDCSSMQRQGSDGVCICDAKGYTTTSSGLDFGVGCLGGCSLSWGAGYMSPGGPALFTSSNWTNINPASTVYAYVRQTGTTCQTETVRLNVTLTKVPQDTSGKAADGVTADPLNKPETNQSPDACAAVGGSFAVINGKSACLTDTANKMDKLAVTKKSTTTVNPDGTSSVKVESTYKQTDAVTGETKSTTTSTTQTLGVNGAVTGTGTTSGTGSGTVGDAEGGASDLCKNNPGLDVCNNRLNKEETQLKIKDSLSADGFDAATHITPGLDASPEAKKELADKALDIKAEIDKFGTASDPASSRYAEFREAMGGWFDPIPSSSCSPFSFQIGPWTWHFDICPTAQKISEIGAYCMWVMLAFGVFALVTKEGK